MNKYLMIIIVGLILSLFLVCKFQSCHKNSVPISTEKIVQRIDTTITYLHDTVFQTKLAYKTIHTTTHDSFNVYKDTIIDNGSSVVVTDTIKNDI